MARLLVIVLCALLLPVQFAWSAASAYCQHETTVVEADHIGHHAHVHQSEEKAGSDGGGKLSADPDCASCHSTGSPAIASRPDALSSAGTDASASPRSPPPFTSAPARAPDRPQWPRLV